MLTRDEIIWGYRYILGRDPESEDVIARCMSVKDIYTFRAALLASDEFIKTNKLIWLQDRWVLAPVMEGQRLMWIDLGDKYVSFGCLLDGYEPAESRFVRKNLTRGDAFLDVGANIGWFTMLASTIVGNEGKIYAFEPRPRTRDYLEKTIRVNHLTNVTLYKKGLYDSNSPGTLAWKTDTDNPGGSFIMTQPSGSDMKMEAVELITLDSLKLERVDFIKIDIEGAEMRAMNGALTTLSRCRPIVLSELYPEQLLRISGQSAEDYVRFFRQLDYRCFIVDVVREGEEIQGFPSDWYKGLMNVGFVPKERLP